MSLRNAILNNNYSDVKMDFQEISYGPVKIIDGPHVGRIGYYDDDEIEFTES